MEHSKLVEKHSVITVCDLTQAWHNTASNGPRKSRLGTAVHAPSVGCSDGKAGHRKRQHGFRSFEHRRALQRRHEGALQSSRAMPKLRKPKSVAQSNGHVGVYAAIVAVVVLVAAYTTSSSSEPQQKPPSIPQPQPNRNRKESAKIFAQAFELYSKQDMSGAAKRFEDYLRLEPRDVSAYNNLGLVHTELGDFDAAIGSFERALAIDAAHADTHSNLGITYGKAGRAHESRAAYAAALRANPAHANAAGNLALELTRAEPPRWQEAVAVLEAVLEQEGGTQDLAPTRQMLAAVRERAQRARPERLEGLVSTK